VIVCVALWVSRSGAYNVVLTWSGLKFVIILVNYEFLMNYSSIKLRECGAQHGLAVDLGRVCWEITLSSRSLSLEQFNLVGRDVYKKIAACP